MSKTVSTALKGHMAETVTSLTTCWLIDRLDGALFGFTTLDMDLTVDGQLYQSTAGFSRSAIVSHSTGEVDNLEVLGYFSETGIIERDLRNGKFDYASIYVFVVNWSDLTQGICRMRRGYLGECIRSPSGFFQAELRGLTQALVQEFGNFYSPLCRADLGDSKCTFDILSLRNTATVTGVLNQRSFTTTPLVYNANVMGNTGSIDFQHNVSAGTEIQISDGVNTVGITFLVETHKEAAAALVMTYLPGSLAVTATRSGNTINIVNNSGRQGIIQKTGDTHFSITISDFTAAYLDNGTITWITGDNAGLSIELKTYAVEGQIVYLWLGMRYPIQVGDTFYYVPGCDKRRDTCFRKFNNILNMRAEPDMPGPDKMLAYPDVA